MYTDISTVVFSHIVLNDGQWTVGFVLDSNDLMSTNNYQQRVLKQLTKGRRQWIEQGTRQLQQNVQQAQQLQESQQQLQQHLQICQGTFHTQPHHEQRCRSCFDTTCNMSSCIFLFTFLYRYY